MRIAMVVMGTLLLIGCSVGTSKPTARIADRVIEQLTYDRDKRTGQCFAMISTSHATSASDDGLSITWVPCDPKVLEQIGK